MKLTTVMTFNTLFMSPGIKGRGERLRISFNKSEFKMNRKRIYCTKKLRPGDKIESYDGTFYVSSNCTSHLVVLDEEGFVKFITHSTPLKSPLWYVYPTMMEKIQNLFSRISYEFTKKNNNRAH